MEKYVKKYEVRGYECDKDAHLRLISIFNLMQDIADKHASVMEVGYEFCKEHGIGWVGGNYHLKIHRLPKWEEMVELRTWPSDKTFVTGIREFEALDGENKPLFMASSQWVLIDTQRLRPVAVAKHLYDYELLPERMIETKFPTPPHPVRVDFEKIFYVRYDDIDVNNHVNNAVYPVWACEAVPMDFRQMHDLAEVEVSFKKSAVMGDVILIKTQIEDNVTHHVILNQAGDKEFALLQVKWKKKES